MTNSLRSALMAMLCTVLNSLGPGLFGSLGGLSPVGDELIVRTCWRRAAVAVADEVVPSGSHAMSVGRSNVSGPRPRTPSCPLLCTSLPS